jgi:hypothetical protein
MQHDGRELLGSLSTDTLGYIYNNRALKPDIERDAQKKIA